MRFQVASALTLLPTLLGAQASPSPLWFDLDPGLHAVGFRVEYLLDSTRPFFEGAGPTQGRPIRVMLWYPAAPSDARRLTFGEYLAPAIPPGFEAYGRFLRSRDSSTASRQFAPVNDSLARVVAETRTAAVRNAPAAAGRFPLVLHALGRNDYQLESTVLWEYLASHGYVVAVVPQVGPSASESGVAYSAVGLAVQLADLRVAQAQAERLPFVDPASMAVVGHSLGALVAALLATGPRPPAAVVSLDGSIAVNEGRALLEEGGWDGAAATAALLNLYRAGNPREDLTALDAWRGDRYDVRLGADPPRQATHFDFQNWPLFAALTGVPDERGVQSRDVATGRGFYLAVCRLTRLFLDGVLRDDPAARRSVRGESPVPGLDRSVAEFAHRQRP